MRSVARIRTAGNAVRETGACVYLLIEYEIYQAKRIYASRLASVKTRSAGDGRGRLSGAPRNFEPPYFHLQQFKN